MDHHGSLFAEVERICALGNRFVGTAGERACREYLLDALAAAGAQDIHLEPVRHLGMSEATASCEVVDGPAVLIHSAPLQYTAPAVVTAPAVYLGDGADGTLEQTDVDLAGRVVVLEPPLIMTVAAELARRGAAAIVHVSSTLSAQPGHFTARFPAPREEPWEDWPLPIPGVTIDAASARRLLERMTQGPVRLRVAHHVEYAPAQTANVVGVLPGRERDGHVVVGAHYGSQRAGLGAADNATGLAALLALARGWQPGRLRRSVVVVAFAAEEIGAWGSQAFGGDAARAARTAAMVNLDAMGNPLAATRTVIASPELEELAAGVAAEAGWEPEAVTDAAAVPLADHAPFVAAGIPACWLFRYPPNHPYYHCAEDVPRHVDPARLAEDAHASIAVVRRLADADGL